MSQIWDHGTVGDDADFGELGLRVGSGDDSQAG